MARSERTNTKASAPIVDGVQSMKLDIESSFNPRIITRFVYRSRVYHVLFDKFVDGPFEVTDSPYQVPGSMLTIGQILKRNPKNSDDVEIVGTIFHTSLRVDCTGSYLLVYSGAFQDQVQKRVRAELLPELPLLIKTDKMQVYGATNKVVLVVSPFLRREILDVLEM